MTIAEVLEKIKAFHPPIDESRTRDTVKCGDVTQECTGVATTCYASYDVICRAIEKGCNLIITHEPTFYSDDEDSEGRLDNNETYLAKKKLIDDNGIVIWRDHDHIHGGGPGSSNRDYIFYGIMKVLGWDEYLVSSERKPLLYKVPKTTVRGLTHELMEKIGLNGARIIGDPDAPVETVFICEHITANPFRGKRTQLEELEEYKPDAIIPLETIDWTIAEYVIDSCALGNKKAIISMGHFNFEEPGMKYMAEGWLPEVLENKVPCHFVPSADNYNYIV
jgi:hypothetical protein